MFVWLLSWVDGMFIFTPCMSFTHNVLLETLQILNTHLMFTLHNILINIKIVLWVVHSTTETSNSIASPCYLTKFSDCDHNKICPVNTQRKCQLCLRICVQETQSMSWEFKFLWHSSFYSNILSLPMADSLENLW